MSAGTANSTHSEGSVIRHSRVDLTLTPEEALEATGFRIDRTCKSSVMETMPRSSFEEGKTEFFKLSGDISPEGLEEEYRRRGLVPEFPDRVARVNQDNPSFALSHPNLTQWKSPEGNYRYAGFRYRNGQPRADVHCCRADHGAYWWYAGRRP